jgi:predicted transcriptional regulator
MNRTSRALEKKAVDLHFKGVSRDAIANLLGIPPATVSDILGVLPESLSGLRALSVELKKKEMSVGDAVAGVHIRDELKAMGIEPKRFPSALKAVVNMATDARYKPKLVVQAASRLVELENEAGKGYVKALEDFELLNEKNFREEHRHKKLRKRNLHLKSQILEYEQRLVQLFKAVDDAPEDISQFKMCKEELLRYGLNFTDVDVIVKLLKNFKEAGGDVKKLISLVKIVGSLIRKKANLDNDVTKLREKKSCIRAQADALSVEHQRKNNLHSELGNKIQFNHSILASQENQIQMNHAMVCRINADYQRIDSLRRQAITQLGRIAGMSEHEVQQVRVEADFDIAFSYLQERIDAFERQRWKEFSKG